jgi:hypothetical protein
MRLARGVAAALESLHGNARRQLLMLTTFYFAILYLESEVSHMPLLSASWWNLALVPVVWLAVSLLTLMAVLLWPSVVTSRVLQVAMVVAAVVGVLGVFPHLAANGISWNKPGSLFSAAAFHGEPGPQWPLAITIGAVLGFIGGYGITGAADIGRPVRWLTRVAFLLLIVGIALSSSLTTLGWGATAVVAAALLLLAITLVHMTEMTRREAA